jgi:hypothetical protein
MSEQMSYEAPRPTTFDSEQEIFSRFLNPEGKTSFKDQYEYDPIKKKVVKRAVNLGFPELNVSDLTSGILVGQKSEFAFAWHTVSIINMLIYIQKESGYDMTNLIKFHYDNLFTNLSLSKSVDGALMKALTTKELKQISEHRVANLDGSQENSPKGLFDLLKGRKRE